MHAMCICICMLMRLQKNVLFISNAIDFPLMEQKILTLTLTCRLEKRLITNEHDIKHLSVIYSTVNLYINKHFYPNHNSFPS